ncbi:MAG: aminomethyl-transferring glycine dehydrogenase subunit GcvPB [Candidatus Bipolaricaulota bacterium]
MADGERKKLRSFHQAKWDEPIIYELSTPGERGIAVPKVDGKLENEVRDPLSLVPENMQRKEPPNLPEMSQHRVLRHYIRLSQENLGVDVNVDIGQGTCTMKYSPKANEDLARSPQVIGLHPRQPESTVQGILEIMYKMDQALQELSGMDKFSFQPGGGSQAALTMASMIKAYHRAQEEDEQRDEMISTTFSHPSDQAVSSLKGYRVVTIPPNQEGYPDLEALKAAVSDRTAGLILANPEDTGLFNPKIKEFTKIVHQAGGLCAYDQANANGILGITRALEAGFDTCFFNLHKTFSSPHGCGGPASGAVGVTDKLTPFLPVPLVEKDGEDYFLNYDLPNSMGKIRSFFGVAPVVLRAYSWIRSLGAEGIKDVARTAVMNNNYVMRRIMEEVPGATVPYDTENHRVEQVRYSFEELAEDTGLSIHDIQRRMFDFAFHIWTSHHPWDRVPEPFTLEPTESYSKSGLDEYVDTLAHIAREAYENPEIIENAPHRSVVHRIDESPLDDPEQWAVTWRAYQKKYGEEFQS